MNDGCTPRRPSRGLGALVALLALLGASRARAATATFTGTSSGQQTQGTTTTPPNTFGNVFAGVFLITIDGGPQTNAYCVDINNPISVGESEPQVTPDYPCEVVYILNNAYPTANNIAGRLSNLNQEAASVQAAIWHYTDTFNPTGPSAIVARANQIITAAQSQCQTVPPVPQSITMAPPGQDEHLRGRRDEPHGDRDGPGHEWRPRHRLCHRAPADRHLRTDHHGRRHRWIGAVRVLLLVDDPQPRPGLWNRHHHGLGRLHGPGRSQVQEAREAGDRARRIAARRDRDWHGNEDLAP